MNSKPSRKTATENICRISYDLLIKPTKSCIVEYKAGISERLYYQIKRIVSLYANKHPPEAEVIETWR